MDSVSFKPIAMLCLVRRAQPRVGATNHWLMVQKLPFRKLLEFRLAKMDSFGGRLEENLVADDSSPRDLIRHNAMVLRAVEPSQNRFLQFLAFAHAREFMAEDQLGNKRDLDWPVSFGDGLVLCMLGHLAAHLWR